MKDSTQSCQHTLAEDLIYKEVVVIGNGPSGMVTSFMLAGNVPYLKKVPEDLPIDEMLKARLSNLPEGRSLYETDLIELAEGLEGRSQNPIPLLMDNLLRPCADLGIQADPLIEWKYDVEKQIEHIVLGRGPPGGSWHTFPRSVRTLSPAAWLALPPHSSAALGSARLSARTVAQYCRKYVQACKLQRYFRNNVVVNSVTLAPPSDVACAAPRCPLAARYLVSGYDKTEGRMFRYACHRVVLCCGCGDRPNSLPAHHAAHSLHSLAALERQVHELVTSESPGARFPVLVVGSGVSAADAVALARRGGLRALHLHRAPAEALARLAPPAYPDYCQVYKMMCDGPSGNHPNYTPYPHHMIVDVAPHTPPESPSQITPKMHPDIDPVQPKRVTILDLHTNETTEIIVSMIGVFIGSKPNLFFLQTNFDLNCIDIKTCENCIETKKIEEKRFFKNHWMYFKNVLQSIQNCKSKYFFTDDKCNCDNISYDEDIKFKCQCRPTSPLANGIGCQCRPASLLANGISCQCRPASPLANGIGCQCRPASSLANGKGCHCRPASPLANGIGFGVDVTKPVDSRNPIAIDKGTHEVLNSPKGMYALGPLTADNFVRFIPGGALALVTHIHSETRDLV